MKLELVRDKSSSFPIIDNPLDYTDIRVWHCNYQSLSDLRHFQNAKTIEIATYPDASLDFIGKLSEIKSLKILHSPKVYDISPLSNLHSLEILELATLPSWDASGKNQHISSLAPLSHLENLWSLALFGIVIDDGSLHYLYSCQKLKEFHCGNKFSTEEFARLKANRPNIAGRFLNPLVETPSHNCSKCGTRKVVLSGVIKYAIQCPKCNANRVQKHLTEWQAYQIKTAA